MSNERIVVIGAGAAIGHGVARALMQASHRVEIVSDREHVQREIEKAKRRDLAAHEHGRRAGSRESQDRIKAMQMRKAQEASAKNARRAMNQTRGKKR